MSSNTCPICGNAAEHDPRGIPYKPRYECRVCGTYRLSEHAAQELFELRIRLCTSEGGALPDHHLLSAAVRDLYERSGKEEVFIPDLGELRARAAGISDPFESVDRILQHVVRSASRAGAWVPLRARTDYPIAAAQDPEEFEYLLSLGMSIGYYDVNTGDEVRPTAAGWKRVGELRMDQGESSTAFVAMSFRDDTRQVYEIGIEPALRETGYDAIRVDLVEHNGKIDDRIVADIRKSSICVADFTGHRANVYFEAGFALGLSRIVIFTCHRSDISNAHFDTRQYNHIVWDDPGDLRTKLRNRIEATVPRPNGTSTALYGD